MTDRGNKKKNFFFVFFFFFFGKVNLYNIVTFRDKQHMGTVGYPPQRLTGKTKKKKKRRL